MFCAKMTASIVWQFWLKCFILKPGHLRRSHVCGTDPTAHSQILQLYFKHSTNSDKRKHSPSDAANLQQPWETMERRCVLTAAKIMGRILLCEDWDLFKLLPGEPSDFRIHSSLVFGWKCYWNFDESIIKATANLMPCCFILCLFLTC